MVRKLTFCVDGLALPDGRWVAVVARHIYGPEDVIVLGRQMEDRTAMKQAGIRIAGCLEKGTGRRRMKQNLHLILWILTMVLMTLAMANEFFGGQPLSLLGFVFVLALALSAIGAAVEDWAGRDSGLSRFW